MWRKRVQPGERIVHDAEKSRERTMNRAVKLLAAKPRSVGELRERLLEKMWTDEKIVEGVIAKLLDYDYLDDERFASDLALSKLRQRPQGKRPGAWPGDSVSTPPDRFAAPPEARPGSDLPVRRVDCRPGSDRTAAEGDSYDQSNGAR